MLLKSRHLARTGALLCFFVLGSGAHAQMRPDASTAHWPAFDRMKSFRAELLRLVDPSVSVSRFLEQEAAAQPDPGLPGPIRIGGSLALDTSTDSVDTSAGTSDTTRTSAFVNFDFSLFLEPEKTNEIGARLFVSSTTTDTGGGSGDSSTVGLDVFYHYSWDLGNELFEDIPAFAYAGAGLGLVGTTSGTFESDQTRVTIPLGLRMMVEEQTSVDYEISLNIGSGSDSTGSTISSFGVSLRVGLSFYFS